jgi:hypothetical protein
MGHYGMERVRNMPLKSLSLIGGLLALLFTFGCSNPPTAQNENSSSSTYVTKDSLFAWTLVQNLEHPENRLAPNLLKFGNDIYTFAQDGYLYKNFQKITQITAHGDPSDLDTAFNSIWAINAFEMALVRVQNSGKIDHIQYPDSIVCPRKKDGYQCAGNVVTSYNNQLIVFSSDCMDGADCYQNISCAKVSADSVWDWQQCLPGWSPKLNSWMANSSIVFQNKLYVTTWNHGIIRWDGQKWEKLSYQLDPIPSTIMGYDSLKQFRTKPVIHEGQLVVADLRGIVMMSSNGDDWKLLLNSERKGFVFTDKQTGEGYSIIDTVKDAYRQFGFSLLSANHELYFGNNTTRRNFKDSIWEYMVRPTDSVFWKDRPSPSGSFFGFQGAPGRMWALVERNDTLFAAITSTDSIFNGIWALDLKKHRTPLWEQTQLRYNLK